MPSKRQTPQSMRPLNPNKLRTLKKTRIVAFAHLIILSLLSRYDFTSYGRIQTALAMLKFSCTQGLEGL